MRWVFAVLVDAMTVSERSAGGLRRRGKERVAYCRSVVTLGECGCPVVGVPGPG